MTLFRSLLSCVLLAALAASASAGIFFNRQAKPKPKPEDRVPELITAVKTDPDENKRIAAATELRQYDTKIFQEIVPVLAEIVRVDAKAGVRYEAAVTLSHIRPVSVEAGQALEYVAAHDPAFYVRMQARTSLVYYRLSGYRAPKPKETQMARKIGAKKKETASPKEARMTPLPRPSETVRTVGQARTVSMQPLPDNTVARPLPAGPAQSPLVPVEPPKLETPPPSGQQDGPALAPPDF